MEAVGKQAPNDGKDHRTDSAGDGPVIDPHAEHIDAQIGDFRKQLLGMTLRNHLLHCPHGPRVQAQVRVIDELPDMVFERLEVGGEFSFLPLPVPRDQPDDEDSEEFLEALERHKQDSETYKAAIEQVARQPARPAGREKVEREARDLVRLRLGMGEWEPERGLDPEELCRRRGIDPEYELPASSGDGAAERHRDSALQTLLPEEVLSASLARLRDRARSSIRQTGVATLFAAFGFLEWFDSDDSDQAHLAPLVLVPGELDRQLVRGRYVYRFQGTGEPATANVTLAVFLRQNFGLELPAFDTDDSPESYFEKVNDEICTHRGRWRVRRFLTIDLFAYSKLAIYQDLDGNGWPEGHGLVAHGNIRTLLAQSGVSDIPYAENREIDADEWAAVVPILIYDADSSQHSAIADVLSGKNLTIFGPPGTGKSQTIANTIAAAIMANKRVLFVAEKLTALEVVEDRLEKAGLGPFCFNLHAQGLKASAVRRSLEQRVSMPRPDFDPSRYDQQRQAWTRQRDGLRTYARVMGTKVGKFDETVHDVLWRTIDRKSSDAGLPSAVSAAQLANVEEVTPAEVDTARDSIDRLAHAESAFTELVESSSRLPWRGAERVDLSPVEVGATVQLLAVWEQRLADLEALLSASGLDGDAMTIREAGFVHLGAEAVQRMPDALGRCDFASLSRQDTREGMRRAADRAVRIRKIAGEMNDRFGIAADELPDAVDLHGLGSAAVSLGISAQSAREARSGARSLREMAERRDRIDGILGRLADCFGLEAATPEICMTMEQGVELLQGADAGLLSSRTDALTTHDAGRILERAERECRELKQFRDELVERFDLGSMPAKEELQQAARSLNASRGPLVFDGPAKRAMRLYREISLVRSKASREEAAGGVRELIEYRDKSERLAEDEEFKRCLGADWRGVETDLAPAGHVAGWTAEVFERLAGEGDGRSEARRILLHGDVQRLDEIRRIAEALPADWQRSGEEPEPSEARESAERLEAVADGLQNAGLDVDEPFASAVDLAALVRDYRSLVAEAESDGNIALVFPSEAPEVETLDLVRMLADAMSALGLSDASWKQAATFLAQSEDVQKSASALRQAFIAAAEAWQACVESLQLDAAVFLDGGKHETTGFGALRERAREARDAQDTLLSWSSYRRARKGVQKSHAAPVLAALDEHGMSARKLREAYEWALYRSLAARVYRRHPELNELSSWQLGNYREAFKGLEARLQELERARIAYELYSRTVDNGISFGGPSAFTEKALIQHQLSLQRSSVTLRNLLRRAGTALLQMKPCFMMSPRTVAELLPRDSELFDIVVIDEASQMLPCDALGAIARGRQAVIVGDPKQLPPSTYFQGGSAAPMDDDDDQQMLAPMVESILDLSLSAWHPPRYLQWHYRSRHSGLIQFSNVRFYDNRLIVFPGPDESREGSGIRYHHVADGLAKGGLNRIEAERVVGAACTFMEDPANRDMSLAIVAMNQRQRDHINEMLDRETATRPAVVRYRRRWRNTLYPFIVRNLETVQGDERDVIFISTVYGREKAGGPVMRRFGPITHSGGERRLNVLFSRARQRMEVFSSMQANDIAVGPGVSEGVRILRDYLEYAATGKIETGLDTGREPESPFEEYVLERLRGQGLEVDPQVGVAGFRIDLGVRHPDYPHGYLLGVECDGRAYHSALSVRDRDRLREAVLRDLGWDIYRIWSTDWFEDADRELKKLMEYIASRLEAFRAGTGAEDAETVLLGEAVEQSEEQPVGASMSQGGPEELDDEPLCVEVGDTVSYHEAGRGLDIRRVTIVRGKDDSAKAIINDNKPLAVALLGAEVGETVTVRQPTSELDIIVDRIERPEWEVGEAVVAGASTSVDGVELAPYLEWRGHAVDPRTASQGEAAQVLCAIIETEGPVLENRAYQTYVRASGIQRLGPQIRRILNRALAKLERDGRVVVERAAGERGYRNAVLRTPETDRIRMRDIGPRSFDEVPGSELVALAGAVKRSKADANSEEVYREVLDIYGLVRMTAQVKKRFEEASAQP